MVVVTMPLQRTLVSVYFLNQLDNVLDFYHVLNIKEGCKQTIVCLCEYGVGESM